MAWLINPSIAYALIGARKQVLHVRLIAVITKIVLLW